MYKPVKHAVPKASEIQ